MADWIIGGNVYDVAEGAYGRHDIEITDGCIKALVDGAKPGPDDQVVDVDSAYLLPGLIDCHVHLCLPTQAADPSNPWRATACPVPSPSMPPRRPGAPSWAGSPRRGTWAAGTIMKSPCATPSTRGSSKARGELDKALAHSERALELNPNDGDLLANHAQTLTSAGQSQEARRWVEDAMRRNPQLVRLRPLDHSISRERL